MRLSLRGPVGGAPEPWRCSRTLEVIQNLGDTPEPWTVATRGVTPMLHQRHWQVFSRIENGGFPWGIFGLSNHIVVLSLIRIPVRIPYRENCLISWIIIMHSQSSGWHFDYFDWLVLCSIWTEKEDPSIHLPNDDPVEVWRPWSLMPRTKGTPWTGCQFLAR